MFMFSHSVVIFLFGDPPMVFRPSLIFLGFMRFGANETHEMIVGVFFSTDVFLWRRAGRGHAFPKQTVKAHHTRYVEALFKPMMQTPHEEEPKCFAELTMLVWRFNFYPLENL